VNPQTATELAIGACTVIMSMAGSAFIAGARWGRLQSEMATISNRLSRIEGMFTLSLKDNPRGG
jgi:hypothetical protein